MVTFKVTIISNMKVMMIQIKIYQSKNIFKSHLKDIIIYLQKSDTWEIQLAIGINFISSKDMGEEQIVRSKSDDIEVMAYVNLDKMIEELFESLLSRF